MTDEEMQRFLRGRRERWQRWLAELGAWKPGQATWKPVLTAQQQKEQDEYIKRHNLPF